MNPKGGAGGEAAGTSVMDVLSAIPGAIGQALGVIEQAVNAMKPFVAALNPAAVQMFDMAVTNVMATIGQALLPVLQTLTTTFWEFSGILGSTMRGLAPVLEQVAQVIRKVLIADVQQIGAVLEVLGVVIEALTPVFDYVATVMQIVAAALRVLADVLKWALGWLKPLMDWLMSAMKDYLKAIVLVTAFMMKLAGLAGILDSFVAALRKQAEPGREVVMAPQGVQTTGLEQVAKTLTESAVLAGAGEAEKTTNEWLKQLADDVEGLTKNVPTFKEWVGEMVQKIIDAIKDAARPVVPGQNPRDQPGDWFDPGARPIQRVF